MAGPPCGIFPESTRERREFKIAFYLVPYFFNVLSFFRGGGRERGVDLNQGNVGTEKEKETLVLSDGFAVAPGGGGELAVDDWRIPFEKLEVLQILCSTTNRQRFSRFIRTMALGTGDNKLRNKSNDTVEEAQKAAHCTRIIGRKRVASPQATGELSFSSSFKPSCQKRRCARRPRSEALNRLELLPQDILVCVLCCVNHGDLKQLLFVSKAIRHAALLARELHFTFKTPMSKPTFKGDSSEEEADARDSHETPNAPRRISRTRLGSKDLASITVALFASSDEV